MKSKTWTWKTSYTLLSHESNTWSKAACIEWCEGAALKPKNHTFVNAHWQPRPVCQLRKSLHNGEKLRCGWDVNTRRCNLNACSDLAVNAAGEFTCGGKVCPAD